MALDRSSGTGAPRRQLRRVRWLRQHLGMCPVGQLSGLIGAQTFWSKGGH